MTTIRELVKERTLELETVKTRILEAGQGYPTFCLHGVGFTSGAETWLPCIKDGLAEKLHVVAIDMLGWGAADRPTWNYSFAYLVDHVREIQDALGFEKINVVGHSLGGWVAAVFAYESPDRVNKLALVANAGLNPDPPEHLAHFEPPTRDQIAAGLQRMADEEMRELLIEARWRNATTANGEEAYIRVNENLHDYDMRARYFLRRRLAKIQAPTLIVSGENDHLFPPDPFGQGMTAIPGSRIEVLKAGHFMPIENSKELSKLLGDFLA